MVLYEPVAHRAILSAFETGFVEIKIRKHQLSIHTCKCNALADDEMQLCEAKYRKEGESWDRWMVCNWGTKPAVFASHSFGCLQYTRLVAAYLVAALLVAALLVVALLVVAFLVVTFWLPHFWVPHFWLPQWLAWSGFYLEEPSISFLMYLGPWVLSL